MHSLHPVLFIFQRCPFLLLLLPWGISTSLSPFRSQSAHVYPASYKAKYTSLQLIQSFPSHPSYDPIMNTASPFRKPKYSKPHHLYSHIFISRMCLSLPGLLPFLMGLIRTPAEAPILSPSLQDPCCFLWFSLACS